jgi:PAS domain S-box-containing protein
VQEKFRRAVQEGADYEVELRCVWPDGSIHWNISLGRAFCDKTGQPVRLVGVARDITARKEAEQAHRRTEERYRSIVETAEEGIWLVDREWRITFVNRRLARMFGYTAEEMLGRHISEFMDEEERRAAPEHMRSREQGQRSTHDSKFRRKDGSVLWAIVAGNPLLDEQRRFTGALALIADITARKEAEEKLRQSAEAIEALSRCLLEVQETERQALARELHDEVGQSLTLLKLAVDRCRQADPAEVRARLEETQAMLGELVRRVRNMSLDLRPSMLDDLGLLPALLWQFDRYRAQTQIEVLFTQAGLEGRRFGTHVETAVFRIVQEALTNVARHAGVRTVSVHVGAQDEVLRVQVQDGGRGFDVEAAQRADASVGLRGMFERARLLGGRLEINSDPAAGTFLTARVPFRASAPTPDAASPGGPASAPQPSPG